MTRLIPADKGTHAILGALLTLILLPFGWIPAAAGCAVVAVGREVYGRIKRATPMTRDNWIESAKDIAWTLAGGGVVLAPYLMLLESLA